MRVFALSDIHVDYTENMQWLLRLEKFDYQDDILILAGDVTDKLELLQEVFDSLCAKFKEVLFVPGNHELWVLDDDEVNCSVEKFHAVTRLCENQGVRTGLFQAEGVSFVPLLSWYDFSFGEPDRHLRRAWRDFRACQWPSHLEDSAAVCNFFLEKNLPLLNTRDETVISYSHFLPRIDVMPSRIPQERRLVYPVLGSALLGEQLLQLKPDIHVYGHSHVNQSVELDNIRFVNNAFAYPSEERISRKRLHCVFADSGAES
jgi:predicted phosphodiesterase